MIKIEENSVYDYDGLNDFTFKLLFLIYNI